MEANETKALQRLYDLADEARDPSRKESITVACDIVANAITIRDANEVKWLPMDTTPRDRVHVLIARRTVTMPTRAVVEVAYIVKGKWYDAFYASQRNEPFAWMPIPPVPT